MSPKQKFDELVRRLKTRFAPLGGTVAPFEWGGGMMVTVRLPFPGGVVTQDFRVDSLTAEYSRGDYWAFLLEHISNQFIRGYWEKLELDTAVSPDADWRPTEAIPEDFFQG